VILRQQRAWLDRPQFFFGENRKPCEILHTLDFGFVINDIGQSLPPVRDSCAHVSDLPPDRVYKVGGPRFPSAHVELWIVKPHLVARPSLFAKPLSMLMDYRERDKMFGSFRCWYRGMVASGQTF
jgi:hypothetical protein